MSAESESQTGQCAEKALEKKTATRSFIIIGIAVILPWNCFLSASDFFNTTAFPNYDWSMYSTQVYQSVFLVTQVAMVFFGSRLGLVSQFLVPLIGCIVCSVVFMIVAIGPHGFNTGVRFALCLALTAIYGNLMGVMQAAAFGVAAQGINRFGNLPGQVMIGMGFAGIIAMALALVTQIGSGSSTIAFIVLFVAIVILSSFTACLYGTLKNISNAAALPSDENPELGQPLQDTETWGAFRSVYQGITYELAVFCVFAVTFMVFPAKCVQWKGSGPVKESWYVTLVMGDFQIFDTVGRWSAENVKPMQALGGPKVLWVLIIARLIFVPLFYLCVDSDNAVVGSQAFQLLLMCIFAMSNGLLSSLAMQFGPKHVNEHARKTVGMAMTLFLVGGIAAGSYLALLPIRL